LTTYLGLRSYLEYFRALKYNEYIAILRREIRFVMMFYVNRVEGYLDLYLFSNKAYFFFSLLQYHRMLFYYYRRVGNVNLGFFKYLFLTSGFCQLGLVFPLLINIYNLFYRFFQYYLSNYGVYSAYLSFSDNFLLNDEHSRGISRINQLLVIAEERDFFVHESESLENILLTCFKDLLLQDFLFSPLFNKFFFFQNIKFIPVLSKKRNNFSLFYNVVNLSMVYYMSEFFFENFMHMECYLYPRAFSFFDVMLGKMAIIFGFIKPNYHFRPERLTLDTLL